MERRSPRALFLDRDGVVIKDTGFPFLPEHLQLCDHAVSGMRAAQELGFTLIVVTNQSGIARGIFSLDQYLAFESFLKAELAARGVFLAKTYFCPHLPDAPIAQWSARCDCRKPAPGMILKALADFRLDPQLCFLVGDRLTDLGAARAAGLGGYFLVKSNDTALGGINNPPETEQWLSDARYGGRLANLMLVVEKLQTIMKTPRDHGPL